MEYYSATKKKEIMPFTVTWIVLEIIILTKLSQAEGDKYILIICGNKKTLLSNRSRVNH